MCAVLRNIERSFTPETTISLFFPKETHSWVGRVPRTECGLSPDVSLARRCGVGNNHVSVTPKLNGNRSASDAWRKRRFSLARHVVGGGFGFAHGVG